MSNWQDYLFPRGINILVYLQVKGADFRVLDSYSRYVITAAKALDINVSGKWDMNNKYSRSSVIQTPKI